MIPDDTTPAAHAVQVAIWRRLGPEGRLDLMARMCAELRQLARDTIRERHPEYTEEQVRRALFRKLLGDELVHRIWPNEPLLSP